MKDISEKKPVLEITAGEKKRGIKANVTLQ